jgi:hypothetical protein
VTHSVDYSLTVWRIGGEKIRRRFTVIIKSDNQLLDCFAVSTFISPSA